jgi:hypothetical protein
MTDGLALGMRQFKQKKNGQGQVFHTRSAKGLQSLAETRAVSLHCM